MRPFERLLFRTAVALAVVLLVAAPFRYRSELLVMSRRIPWLGRSLVPGSDAPEEFGNNITYWTCSMHPHVREAQGGVCPICGMDLVPVYELGDGAETVPLDQIQVPTPEQKAMFRIDPSWQQAIAVTMAPAERRALVGQLRTLGTVTYNENLITDINLKLEGWIERLHVAETGQWVERGQPLFDLYSPDLVSTQQEYLLALEGTRRLAAAPSPEMRRMARSLLKASRQRLLRWDLTAPQIDALASSGQIQEAMPILSEVSGYVVDKTATAGMHVQPGVRLYRVADLSRVWILADVYESDLDRVYVGQPVTVHLSYGSPRSWRGRVEYIYPTIQTSTRTATVRIGTANPRLTLLPEMYVDVVLEMKSEPVLTVPREAVLDLGLRHVVFVDLGGGRLQAREVRVVREAGAYAQIGAGLAEGEPVVTSGNFLVDAESKVRGVVPLPLAATATSSAPDLPR